MANKIGLRKCIRSNQTGRRNPKPMHIHHHGRRVQGILPFLEMILRTGGHTNHIPGTDCQNIGVQTTRLVKRCYNRNQRNNRKTRSGSKRNNEEIKKRWI